MSNKIVNITYEIVNRKIEEIVSNPASPYDSAFLNPQLRQKLIIKVLNSASPRYVFSNEGSLDFDGIAHCSLSSEEERKIERMIHENLVPVLREENALEYFQTSPSSWQQGASHWFG